MESMNNGTMKYGYLFSRGTHKKYGKTIKRRLALAVVASLMMGGTTVFADTTVIPYEVNGGATYSSGNVVEVNDTEAVISNSKDTSGTGQQISKGDGWQNIYGYQGSEKETSGNTVTVTGTTVSNYISGGGTGTSKNNKVIVDSTTNESIIAGGTSDEGDASSNKVTVQNNSKTQAVYGGHAVGNKGNADHNFVTLTGSTAAREVAGGYVEKGSGNAAGNTVTIENSTVGESIPNSSPYVAGGYVGSSGGNVTDNILTISGTTTLYAGSVAGGYHGGNKDTAASDTYVVSGNQLRMTGGTFKLPDIVTGGRAFNTHVKDNVLTITGDTSISSTWVDLYRPDSQVKLYGGSTMRGNVLHNAVDIDSTGTLVLQTITGGNSATDVDNDTKVSGNTVTIKNGNIYLDNNDGIRGGAASYGHVTDNGVIISGGTVGAHQYAEKMRIVGGSTNNGNATNNYVNISGGTIEPSYKVRIIGGYSQLGTASGNVVNLSGGTLGAENKIVNVVAGEGPVVTDNAINLSGSTDITYANLYGYTRTLDGDSSDSSNENPDEHSGNTLNIGYTSKFKTDESGYQVLDGGEAGIWNGGTVNGIYNFDKVSFYAINPANTALSVTNTSDLTGMAIDLSNLSFSDNGAAVKAGKTITLLENVKNADISNTGLKDYTFDYDLKSRDEKNSLAARGLYEAKTELNVAHSDAENLILKPGILKVSEVNLSAGTIDWESHDSVLNLGSYDFDFQNANLNITGADPTTITGVDKLLASGSTKTMIDGTNAGNVENLSHLAAAGNTYSYELTPDGGHITVTGTGERAVSDDGKSLSYKIDSIEKLSYGEVDSQRDMVLDARGTDLTGTTIDLSNLTLKDDADLGKGSKLTLLSNAGGLSQDNVKEKLDWTIDYILPDTGDDAANSLKGTISYGTNIVANASNAHGSDLVLALGNTVDVQNVTLGADGLDWSHTDPVLTLGDYDFDFSKAVLSLGAHGNMDITGADTLLAAGDSRTLMDGTKAGTVTGLDTMVKNNHYSYDLADGAVTVTGSGVLKDHGKNMDYTISSIDKISYGTLDWKTDGTVVSLDAGKTYDLANTKVDTANISFTAKSLQSITRAGDYTMTLLDTKGNKTLSAGNLTAKEGKWDISNALTGKGMASLDSNGNVVYQMETTNVENVNGEKAVPIVMATEQTHQALIANEAGMGTLAAGRESMEGILDGLQNQGTGIITFATVGGGRDRYDTGSNVTTHTWNGIVGIGNDAKLASGDLTYGVFYEYGKDNYDTSGDGYAGSGDTHYRGGGIMGKFIGKNKTYVEGSLRLGRLDNDADSVLHGTDNLAQSYDTSQNYWAGHVGIGHIFDLTDEVASESRGGTERAVRDLDVYGKYFHTHLDGDNFTAGDVKYEIDSMNSDILRMGARINNRSGNNNLYYGLAWDYEFDGESTGRVSASGLSAPIRKADAGGSSLMAEVGWTLEATPENPWEVTLSLNAYTGQHEGVGGSLCAAYHF